MINRREFLKGTLRTGASLALYSALPGLLGRKAWAAPNGVAGADERFFLLITMPNPASVDSSYLFDARPWEMTKNNAIQNYRTTGEPGLWKGTNGQSSQCTDIVEPLRRLQPYFTVINGVTMATNFDGHDQNFNYLFTGDPFGGESFIPHFNQGNKPRPLDAIQRGRVKATLSNASRTVPLGPKSAAALVASLGSLPAISAQSPTFRYLSARFQAISALSLTGAQSLGASNMGTAFGKSPELAQMIGQLKIVGDDTDLAFIPMLAQFFRVGAAKSAILTLNTQGLQFDTHDVASAKAQPQSYASLVSQLVQVLDALRNTPYDSQRSLMDVTTFMFSAEFGRTMRQNGKPIDASGTDHNSISNSVLIGGAGIKGGQLIGASDYGTSTEKLSGAHLILDPGKLKTMGRPFDFVTCAPRTDLPAAFAAKDYLGFNSLVNTLYSSFGVPSTHWRPVERNGGAASTVPALLV